MNQKARSKYPKYNYYDDFYGFVTKKKKNKQIISEIYDSALCFLSVNLD